MIKNLLTKFNSPQKKKQVFTIQNFVHLGNQLIQNISNPKRIPQIVESIRSIAEILIWSDQNGHEQFFHMFLEMKLLTHFEALLWMENVTDAPSSKSSQTKGSTRSSLYNSSPGRYFDDHDNDEHETVSTLSETSSVFITQFSVARQLLQKQLLQSLAILIQNLSSKDSLYFILSNSIMNQFIKFRYDFHDEEVLDYYITFLKTISNELNTSTIQFFFTNNELLLYQEAKKYLTHKESMIRIAVRTIILNIYSVPAANVREYIIGDAASYLGKTVCFLRSELVQLNQMILDCRYSPLYSSIDSRMNEFQDYIFYLNDLLQLDIHEIRSIIQVLIRKSFINEFLLPSLGYEANDDNLLFGRQEKRKVRRDLNFAMNTDTLLDDMPPNAESNGWNDEISSSSSDFNSIDEQDFAQNPSNQPMANLPSEERVEEISNGSIEVHSNGRISEYTPEKSDMSQIDDLASPVSIFSPQKKSKRLSPEEYFIRRAIQDAVMYVEGRHHFQSQDQDFTRDDIIQWHNQTKLIDSKLAFIALGQIFLVFNGNNEQGKEIYQHLESELQKDPFKFMSILKKCFLSSSTTQLSVGASFLYILQRQASPSFLESWGILPKRCESEMRKSLLLDMLSGNFEESEIQSNGVPSAPSQVLSPRSIQGETELSNIVTYILMRFNHRHLVPRRIITVHLLTQLCFEFTKLSSVSMSAAIYNRVRIKLSNEQQQLLESGVQLARKQLLKHVGEDILDLFPLFEGEHSSHVQLRNILWERLCGDIALVVDDVTNQLQYFKREPTSAIEEIRVDIHIYLALQHLYFISTLDTSEVFNNKLEELIDYTPKYHIGQVEALSSLEPIRIDVIVKRPNERCAIERQFLFADDNFLIVLSNNRNNTGTILSVTPLRRIHMMKSKKHQKALYISAQDDLGTVILHLVIIGIKQSRHDVQDFISEAIEKCMLRKEKLLKEIIHISPKSFLEPCQ